MKIVLAAPFCCGVSMLAWSLLLGPLEAWIPKNVGFFLGQLITLASFYAAVRLFNPRNKTGMNRKAGQAEGALQVSDFQAKRALEIEKAKDGGPR
jgi:hypothetical protein